MTVLDLITDIFLQIGAINQGDTPNPSEQAQVFFAINRRLNQWTANALYIYGVTELTLPLVATKQSYLLGTGGADLNVSRPLIRHARQQLANSSVSLPVEVVGSAEWNAIEEPTLTGQRCQKIFPDYNWPVMTLKAWPVPSANTFLLLYVWTKLSQFATVTDTVDLPDGYLLPLEFQVCLDVWPSYSTQVNPANIQIIMQGAQMAEQTIQMLNAQLLTGRAAGPVPEMPALPVASMPNVQASPGMPPQ